MVERKSWSAWFWVLSSACLQISVVLIQYTNNDYGRKDGGFDAIDVNGGGSRDDLTVNIVAVIIMVNMVTMLMMMMMMVMMMSWSA